MKIALEHRTTYRFDRPVTLGPRILRAETAALAMLAAWLSVSETNPHDERGTGARP